MAQDIVLEPNDIENVKVMKCPGYFETSKTLNVLCRSSFITIMSHNICGFSLIDKEKPMNVLCWR